MKAKIILGCLTGGGLALAAATNFAAEGEINPNPFQVIAARNAFGLRPPPPTVEEPDQPAHPAVDFRLTGVCSLLGRKQALLALAESGKTGLRYLKLAEGEKDGEVEVLAIDMEAGAVELRYGSEKWHLTFGSHGLTPIPAGAPEKPPASPTAATRATAGISPGIVFVRAGVEKDPAR